jgi:hypothetical protein|tara:strand:- start:691 stop:1059 length:369 start_codon:yes stop_codon:yes gene_type:complete
MSKKDPKLNRYTDIECEVCGEIIEGKWDSQVYLGMETGELSTDSIHRWLIYDKHIKCSPSRAQRIVHPKYPTVVDERPQFDWRPEANNAWTEQKRNEFRELYTDAWVRLQERYNPSWEVKLT